MRSTAVWRTSSRVGGDVGVKSCAIAALINVLWRLPMLTFEGMPCRSIFASCNSPAMFMQRIFHHPSSRIRRLSKVAVKRAACAVGFPEFAGSNGSPPDTRDILRILVLPVANQPLIALHPNLHTVYITLPPPLFARYTIGVMRITNCDVSVFVYHHFYAIQKRIIQGRDCRPIDQLHYPYFIDPERTKNWLVQI